MNKMVEIVKMATDKIDIVKSDERLISGWASVEMKDVEGDYIPIDEISKAMLKHMDKGGIIMFAHENKPCGKVLQWEIKTHPETGADGVYVVVKVNRGYKLDDMVWELVKSEQLTGFSIAGLGSATTGTINGEEVRIIKDLEIVEISIVKDPANQYAKFDKISFAKSKKEDELIAIFSNMNNAVEYIKSKDNMYIKEFNDAYIVMKYQLEGTERGEYDGESEKPENYEEYLEEKREENMDTNPVNRVKLTNMKQTIDRLNGIHQRIKMMKSCAKVKKIKKIKESR